MMSFLADHLWQSTLFAAAAALAASALRSNRADVRYAIWLASSLKFLVPFAALFAAGGALGARWLPPAPPSMTLGGGEPAIEPLAQMLATLAAPVAAEAADATFSWTPLLALVWLAGLLAVCARWWAAWRRVAAAARTGSVVISGREAIAMRTLGGRLPIVECDTALEPGVFGILRPVLLWPRGMSAHLTGEQIESIIAHELAHVRRRDNLWSSLHMAAQAICWFHPLVWWIGTRLVHERERACDEAVLRSGRMPHVYAESILKTCEFYAASPLACVSGVTGADLKRRIEDIMRGRTITALSPPRKFLLATAAILTIAVPVAIGGLDARPLQETAPAGERLAFDVASIKPNTSGDGRVSMRVLPGGAYEATNVTLRPLIQAAFRMSDRQVIGGPSWIDTERFDILAKSPDGATQAQFSERLRSLLEDRAGLKTHTETREMPIYALVLGGRDGKLGPRIKPSPMDCSPGAARGRGPGAVPPPAAGRGRQAPMPPMPSLGAEPRPCGMTISPTGMRGGGRTMADLANALQTNAGRVVQDRTGLSGSFDFDLEFTRDPALQSGGPFGALPPQPGAAAAGDSGNSVSVFTAVQEQLGLRLESTEGPVEVLVIDSIERPQEN